MVRWVVWILTAMLPLLAGCQRTGATGGAGTPRPARTAPPAESASTFPARPGATQQARHEAPAPLIPGAPAAIPPVEAPPKPEPPKHVGKEIVIAWEASLMYLLKEGKPTGKPLVINGAKHKFLRDAHLGSFRITEKERVKRSNLYDINGDPLPDKALAPEHGAVMRNWMRLGELAVGLHYSPAFRFHTRASSRHRSHGCYRMSRKDSDLVFHWARVGTPIYVVRYLHGSEWEGLLAVTPSEYLPGYKPATVAKSRSAKSTRASTSSSHRRSAKRSVSRASRARPTAARLAASAATPARPAETQATSPAAAPPDPPARTRSAADALESPAGSIGPSAP